MKTVLFLLFALFIGSVNMANAQTIVRSTQYLQESHDAKTGKTIFKLWAFNLNEWAEITVSGKKTYEYLPYINDKAGSRYDKGEAQFLQQVDKTNWKFYKVDYDGSIDRIDVYFIDEAQLKNGVGAPREKMVNGQKVYYLVLENYDKNSFHGLKAPFDCRIYQGRLADLGDRQQSAYDRLEVYFQTREEAQAIRELMLSSFD